MSSLIAEGGAISGGQDRSKIGWHCFVFDTNSEQNLGFRLIEKPKQVNTCRLLGASYFSHKSFCPESAYIYFATSASTFDNFGLRLVEKVNATKPEPVKGAYYNEDWRNCDLARNYKGATRHSPGGARDVGFRLIEKIKWPYFKTIGGSCSGPISYSDLSSRVNLSLMHRSGYMGLRLIENTNKHFRAVLGGCSIEGDRSCRHNYHTYDNPFNYDQFCGLRLIEKSEANRFRICGSSWYFTPGTCKISYRCTNSSDICNYDVGLRLVEKIESDRVFRGGSWYSAAKHCRVSFRYGGAQTNLYRGIGFRLIEKSEFNNRCMTFGGSWSYTAMDCRVSYCLDSMQTLRFNDLGLRLVEKSESSNRVIHGSGWGSTVWGCRVWARGYDTPAIRGYDSGFRLVCNQSKTEHQINVETQINHIKQRIESLHAELLALEKIYTNG